MTRNFKQHGRDDERPFSRNTPSGRFEGERSPRPARPRLNRESVDRAWENGARQQHPDYRPRGTARSPQPRQQGQSFSDNRRRPSPYGSSSHPDSHNSHNNYNGRNASRPSNNLRNDRRPNDRYERPARRYPESRSFESSMRAFDEDQYQERLRRSSDEGSSSEERPGQGQDRSSQSRPYPPRRYDSRNGTGRSFERDARSGAGRGYERDVRPDREHGPSGNRRDNRFDNKRGNRYENRPDTRNPRFQSRPDRFSRSYQRPFRPKSDVEKFEGDYEQFDAAREPGHEEERHVTRLPDGRVLKGPRKQQREAAEFWTNVDQQAQGLLETVAPEAPAEEPQPKELPRMRRARLAAEQAETEKKPRRTRAASSEASSKKTTAKTTKITKPTKAVKTAKKSKAPANTTRPSKKGFKWPAQE
jgi:hypothetical protein